MNHVPRYDAAVVEYTPLFNEVQIKISQKASGLPPQGEPRFDLGGFLSSGHKHSSPLRILYAAKLVLHASRGKQPSSFLKMSISSVSVESPPLHR